MNKAELLDIAEDAAGSLLLFARQWDPEFAEDVVQEAVLKLVAAVDNGDARPENITGWLFTVVRNESINRLRMKKTCKNHHENYANTKPVWFEPSTETKLDAELVSEKLQTLPLENREVIVAKIWGELSFEQIGELTGTSRSSAHRRYVEGLQMLRDGLK